MRRTTGSSRSWSVTFNATPMIDVIFLLIIFYLCVNQYQKAESTQAVRLPEAASDQVTTPEEQRRARIIINVLANEELRLADQPVLPAELGQRLARRKADIVPDPLEVWIRADRQVPYGVVEPILLACAESGIWKVAFKVKDLRKSTAYARGAFP